MAVRESTGRTEILELNSSKLERPTGKAGRVVQCQEGCWVRL
jgi:hypothetical protein